MSEEQKEKLGSINFSFEVPEVWDAPDFYLAETNAAVFQIITFEQLYMAGVSWAPQDLRGPPPVDWDEAFDALKMYSEKHGDTKVPEQTLFGAGKCFLRWLFRTQTQLSGNFNRNCISFLAAR